MHGRLISFGLPLAVGVGKEISAIKLTQGELLQATTLHNKLMPVLELCVVVLLLLPLFRISYILAPTLLS